MPVMTWTEETPNLNPNDEHYVSKEFALLNLKRVILGRDNRKWDPSDNRYQGTLGEIYKAVREGLRRWDNYALKAKVCSIQLAYVYMGPWFICFQSVEFCSC